LNPKGATQAEEIENVFLEATKELSNEHVDYFIAWDRLIEIEKKDAVVSGEANSFILQSV
jgi:hypothetical protein